MNHADVAAVIESITLPEIGAPFQGGFFIGITEEKGQKYANIAAGMAGELESGTWCDSLSMVTAATSRTDGLANTKAMAEAGSELAQKAMALTINGFSDWAIPAQDQLELMYRHLKPTTYKNWDDRDNGINPSSVPPGEAYTKDFPLQTTVENFREGGADALRAWWHWSSSQHADNPSIAYVQYFDYGDQGWGHKSSTGSARAVRRLPIQ